MDDTRKWKSKEVVHEGFPVLVRYPEGIVASVCKHSFPELAVIAHEFSRVSANGLPEAEYNEALLHFDKAIRSAFEEPKLGSTLLIETFNGKRRYYIYAAKGIDIANTLAVVRSSNPGEKLVWEIRPDPEWTFIKRYRREILGVNELS